TNSSSKSLSPIDSSILETSSVGVRRSSQKFTYWHSRHRLPCLIASKSWSTLCPLLHRYLTLRRLLPEPSLTLYNSIKVSPVDVSISSASLIDFSPLLPI